jgi:dipeptidase
MKVYGRQYGKMSHGIPIPNYDRRRIWRGISLLAPSTNLNPEEPTFRYPLFVKPDYKLTPKDLLVVLADRYQGTKYDHYTSNRHKYRPATTILNANKVGEEAEQVKESPFRLNNEFQYQLSPNWSKERVIGISRSMTNWCAQLRGWMPNPIGGIMWTGIATAETTAHIPFYVANTRTPKTYQTGTTKKHPAEKPFEASNYDENSAYWIFRVLSDLVDLFYEATKDEVIPKWRAWENKLYQLQPTIEKIAQELYKENPKLAKEYLTMYSCDRANEALEMAKEMTKRLYTIIAHYNSTSILGRGPL